MKRFSNLWEEFDYNVPIEKTQINLDDEDTVNELNRNLSLALQKDFLNVAGGLNASKKILSMYGIELPNLEIKNDRSGKFKIPVKQYEVSGETHRTVNPPFSLKSETSFTFKYHLKDGKYEVSAFVGRK